MSRYGSTRPCRGEADYQSKDAYVFSGLTLNDPRIYDFIGTREDGRIVGDIYYQLGFTKDAMTLRE
jgi:hypothetical protein